MGASTVQCYSSSSLLALLLCSMLLRPSQAFKDVGGAALARPGMAPLVVGLAMMAALGALC
ncbi:hypothetical protein TRIUR3_12748 [Triticum urartu]|uniref:Uncharacterized protein n=1 Tax=Triticum urartu TaxID=4572 RepID=M7ZG75_TRIUA|nr:hypothetical protein TRIUR3_12748 [Triticum urartu]